VKIEVIKDKLSLSMEHGVPYGSIQGFPYFVSLVPIDLFVKVPMMVFVFEKGLSKDDVKSIQKTAGMQMVRVDSVALQSNAVLVPFKHGVKNSDKHQTYLEKLGSMFKTLGLKPLNHCPFCGKEDTDSHRIIKGVPVKLHDACAKDFYKEITEKIEEQEHSGDHLAASLFYALMGAIAGAIPTVISIVVFQYMLAILYALIPLGSFYGYKYGKAARKSWVPIYVSVISLIIVLGMNYGLYYTIALAENFTFSEALEVEEFRRAFTSDLGISILFLGIGILISWRKMYTQTTAAIKKNFEGLK
jgi:hypothetical protein